MQAAHRKRVNRINSLENENGRICLSSDEIMGIINSLCQNLYQSQGYRQMNELLDVVPPRLAQAMKDSLNKDFVA